MGRSVRGLYPHTHRTPGRIQPDKGRYRVSSKIPGFPADRPHSPTTTEKIDGVAVTTRANVYFDGKCVSHGIQFPDGTKKSVGVVLPASLTFNTGAAEIMECVGGA